MLVNNQPLFEFLDYYPLKQSDAKSICDCLDEHCADWRNKLVSFGADGAPVNLGCNNGAAHLVVVHGCAHRLELAIKTAAKSCSLMTVVDSVMENAFKIYH